MSTLKITIDLGHLDNDTISEIRSVIEEKMKLKKSISLIELQDILNNSININLRLDRDPDESKCNNEQRTDYNVILNFAGI